MANVPTSAVEGPLDQPAPAGGPVVLFGVSWEQYEAVLDAVGDDHPSLRMTYLAGTLEISTTSRKQERIKKIIARLLEAWAEEVDQFFDGYGAATFKKREAERGLEPDECYVLSPFEGEFTGFPDLAIEVVHTHGVIEKLTVYAGLGVREVWRWEDEAIHVHELVDGKYRPRPASGLLPAVDLALLATFVRRAEHESQVAVVRAYRATLR